MLGIENARTKQMFSMVNFCWFDHFFKDNHTHIVFLWGSHPKIGILIIHVLQKYQNTFKQNKHLFFFSFFLFIFLLLLISTNNG